MKALIDIEKEPWARKMSCLLVQAAKRVARAIAQGRSGLAAGYARRIVAVYDRIVRHGFPSMKRNPRWPGAVARAKAHWS